MSWKMFFFVRVPIALVAIFVAGQGVAMALHRVPLRRSTLDDLALAVSSDHSPHRVVLLGDSITLVSTRRYQLGRGSGDVANLASIAWTGAAAELFLLERYLASHPAPQYVVYASAPDDLDNGDSAQLIHYYDWNVYNKPEEHAFLRKYVPGIAAREWRPAVLNVQENIFERLVSLGRRTAPAMPEGDQKPNPNVQTEPEAGNRMSQKVQDQRERQRLELGTLQQAVFSKICRLSRQYGFQFDIVWPPVPPRVRQAWSEKGGFAILEAQIKASASQGCNLGPEFDVNAVRTYTNFNRDGFHLHGKAWEERYAADLSKYVASLPDEPLPTPGMQTASDRAAGQANAD